jgi:hypothetical protein
MVIPRSWTKPDAVAAMKQFLRAPPPRRAAVRDLMTELLSTNPYARRCAADLARLISAREPGILGRYADVLIDLVAETPLDQWQARGYITLAAALNAETRALRLKLATLVRALALTSGMPFEPSHWRPSRLWRLRIRSCATKQRQCWRTRVAMAHRPCVPAPAVCRCFYWSRRKTQFAGAPDRSRQANHFPQALKKMLTPYPLIGMLYTNQLVC